MYKAHLSLIASLITHVVDGYLGACVIKVVYYTYNFIRYGNVYVYVSQKIYVMGQIHVTNVTQMTVNLWFQLGILSYFP